MMRNRLVRPLSALVLCALVNAQAPVALASEPQLVAPVVKTLETTFKFGSVAQGTKVAHEFAIKNEGNVELVIQRITASCGCTASTVTSRTVAPGATEKLRMEFDTAGFSGSKTKTVEIVTNDPERPEVIFALKGIVEPGITVEPARLEFGEIVPSSAPSERRREFTVKLGPRANAERASVKSYSPYLSVSPVGAGVFAVEVSPDTPRGEFRDRVMVELEGGDRQPINVPVTASLRRDLRLIPSTVSFGVVQGNAPRERRVKLENRGKDPVSFKVSRSKSSAITTSLIEVEPGRQSVLVVTIDPSKVKGDLKSSIEVETSHPVETTLSLNIYGIQAP